MSDLDLDLDLETAPEPPWLRSVRLRAERRMLWCRQLWIRSRYIGEEALAITHSEVERALTPAEAMRREERAFYADDETAAALTAQLESLEHDQGDRRWARVIDLCGLSVAEAALLACALAAEHTPAVRGVYGYLQDETGPLDATPSLVAALWGMSSSPRFGAASALTRWRLARPAPQTRFPESSATPWLADPRLLDYLCGTGDGAPSRTGLAAPLSAGSEPVLFADELARIVDFATATSAGAVEAAEIELAGPRGAGRATLAAQAASRLNRPLVCVHCEAVATEDDPATAAVRELRDAHLADRLLLWRDADLLPAGAWASVRGEAPLTLLTTQSVRQEALAAGPPRLTVELPALDLDRRRQLWSVLSAGPAPDPVAQWRLSAGEIVVAARAAPAGEDLVRAVCRRMLLRTQAELVRPLPLPYGWEDLIAPEPLLAHLHELAAECRNRAEVLDGWGLERLTPLGRGLSALFAGPSGTGKTMAAQVLARELGLDLLRVDLSGVVNKYIGETEKHLRSVFAACERAPVMLFFDEADALFGQRMQVGDAHDRFANIEIDYLLQRMEEFDGVAILSTNRKGDIDSAFIRRLRFVVDFTAPSEAERERLWRAALEPAMDGGGRSLTEPLDWTALARDLDLTGAGIKASALAAAFLARGDGGRICARHVIAAARRELQKQGVVVRRSVLDVP